MNGRKVNPKNKNSPFGGRGEVELKIKNRTTGDNMETITLDFQGSLEIDLLNINEGYKKGMGWMKWIRRDTERQMIKAFIKLSKKHLKNELKTCYPKLSKSIIREGQVYILDKYKKQKTKE